MPKEILVIEKDRKRAKQVYLVLRAVGKFEVINAWSVVGALKIIRVKSFDLILINATIDKAMDGFKMAYLLGKRDKVSKTQILVFIDKNHAYIVNQYAHIDGVELLTFPLPVKELLQSIRASLNLHRKLNQDPTQENIKAVVAEIPALSTVTPVYAELQKLIKEQRESPYEEVNRVINLDPSIEGKVLLLARLFDPISPEDKEAIHSVKDAAILLSIHGLWNMVAIIAIFELLREIKGSLHFDRRAFWEHSIGCGIIARVMAEKMEMDPEIPFAAGVLHDIGKVVLDAHFSQHFAQALKRVAVDNIPLFEAERDTLSTNHEEVGRHLAKHWNLSALLVEAIGAHHNLSPQESGHDEMVDLIHVANALCYQLKVGSAGDNTLGEIQAGVLEKLLISAEELDSWKAEMETEIEKARSVLEWAR